MVDKKSDVGVRLEATFTEYNTNNSCKTVGEHKKYALDMRSRLVGY